MVEPVTIGNATLYLGDCREILPTLSGVEAIVSDPPYGMRYDTDSRRFSGSSLNERGMSPRGQGREDRKIVGDQEDFDPSHLLAYPELIVWGANHYANRLPVGTTLVWLKKSPRHYGTFLSDAEIGWQAGGVGVYVFNAEDSNGRRRLEYTGDIMGKETAHPFQKPIALMDWCVQRVKGEVVCDPYMGSGTTGIACLKRGRKFVGIELDPVYFDIACRRLSDVAKQPGLFDRPTDDPVASTMPEVLL